MHVHLPPLFTGSSVVDEQEAQLTEIVSSVLDPILDNMAFIAASFPSTDADVFQLNSLYQVGLWLVQTLVLLRTDVLYVDVI